MESNGIGSSPRELALATAAIAGATLIWGLSYVTTKFALAEISSFALLGLRLSLSALLMVGILKARGDSISELLKHWRKALPLALGGVIVSQLGYLLGLSYTSPSHGALIYTLLPIFTALLAWIFRSNRLTFWQVFGVFIAFAGAVVLATEGGIDLSNTYFLGDLIMFCAMLGWSYYTVFSRSLVQEIGTKRTLTLTFILCLPVALPISAIPVAQQAWGDVSLPAWLAAGYLVFMATALTLLLYTYSLKHLPPVTVAIFVYIQPVVAAIGSVLILGEVLTLHFFIAAALIFTGLLIFRIRPRRTSIPQ